MTASKINFHTVINIDSAGRISSRFVRYNKFLGCLELTSKEGGKGGGNGRDPCFLQRLSALTLHPDSEDTNLVAWKLKELLYSLIL